MLHGQGLGRHARAQIYDFARRYLQAFSDFLGDKFFYLASNPAVMTVVSWLSSLGAHKQNCLRGLWKSPKVFPICVIIGKGITRVFLVMVALAIQLSE